MPARSWGYVSLVSHNLASYMRSTIVELETEPYV